MDMNKRRAINEISDIIRDFLEVETPITDFNFVKEKLKGKITHVKEHDLEGAEGSIQKIEDEGINFEIQVPEEVESDERRRFSIAHELGHLFLHMGYMINEDLWKETDKTFLRKFPGEMEYEANEFAAAFLMPEDEYKEQLNIYAKDGKCNMNTIAEHFKVSKEAAINRGRWLGLLKW